jgi:S1-C subfamily serine protease
MPTTGRVPGAAGQPTSRPTTPPTAPPMAHPSAPRGPAAPPWGPPTTSPVAPGPAVAPSRRPRRRGLAVAAAVAAAAALAVALTGALAPSSTAPSVSDQRLPTAPVATGAPVADRGTSAIVAAVDPAIVDITTTLDGGEAAGTGMVLTSAGLVLTNNHVIAGSTSISVQIAGTGPSYRAHVVGYDVTDDVAVIQLEGASGLATIPVGKASSVQVGDEVVAIGNALGASGPHAVSTGAVQALDQTITADGDTPGSAETLHGLIQHDATIQPGDSGGALVNSAGQVVGMNSAALASGRRFATTGSSEGYAIPIDDALPIAQHIIDGDASDTIHIGDRAILGVEIQEVGGTTGVIVARADDGPAADAGVQPGDAITGIDSTSISSLTDLQSALGRHQPGDQVKLTWTTSGGSVQSATVTLVAGPPA